MKADIFMMVMGIAMIVLSVLNGWTYAGAMWGFVLGMTTYRLMDEWFYWRIKRKAARR